MFYVEKEMELSAAHYLHLPYESKCTKMHGHNWKIKIYCKSEKLDENGMVVDFSEIKNIVNQLDHKLINDFVIQPTAENIAISLFKLIPKCCKVEVQETDGNKAIYSEMD